MNNNLCRYIIKVQTHIIIRSTFMKIIQPKIKKEFEYEPEEHYTLLQSSYDLYFNKAHIEFDEDTTQMDTLYFNQCTFESIDFTKIHGLDLVFHGCDLSNCQFDHVLFNDNQMSETYISFCKQKALEIKDCSLTSLEVVETSLNGVDLSSNEIEELVIQPTDLKGATVSEYQAYDILPLFGVKVTSS